MKKFLANYTLEILLAALVLLIVFVQFRDLPKKLKYSTPSSTTYTGVSINSQNKYSYDSTLKQVTTHTLADYNNGKHITTEFFVIDTLSDLLPHQIYQLKKDSLERVYNANKNESSESFSGPVGGITKSWKINQVSNRVAEENYFLILPQYFLKEEDEHKSEVIYHVKNKQAFLRVYNYKKDNTGNFMVRKDIPVSFKIDHNNRAVLISITKKQYHIFSVIIWSFSFIIIFLGILVITKTARFLMTIAQGKVFIKKNITRLRNIAIIYIAVTAFQIVVPLIYRLFLSNYLNRYTEFKFDSSIVLRDSIIILVLFSLYKAFKKGYKLQQENDLTV